jgi:NADH dehydrogenase (ubiquinone) flavoprotein 2
LAAMKKIAKILEIPEIEVYEVASFYTMFNRSKVGKFHLQVCGTTPCMLRGANDIISAIEEEAGITRGQTSHDGNFTLTEVECLGACVNAPMIQINNEEVYEDLTPESMKTLMRKLKAGEEVKIGP